MPHIKKVVSFFLFLTLNFAALGLGGIATSKGVLSEWHLQLHQAPWTPPGWFFGVAWTSLMICFAVYMTVLWYRVEDRKALLWIYTFQWFFNVLWNPLFFSLHWINTALFCLLILLIIVWYMMMRYHASAKACSAWLLPYAVWLVVAASLNGYICWYN